MPTLSIERLRELLHYDPETGVFTWLLRPETCKADKRFNTQYAGHRAGTSHTGHYRAIKIDYISYLEHRLAYLYMTGEMPPDEIDHVNGVTSDNRFDNLRSATHGQNMRNREAWGTCGEPCVSIWKGRYRVQIYVNGTQTYFGTYATLDAATAVARSERARVAGDFVRELRS